MTSFTDNIFFKQFKGLGVELNSKGQGVQLCWEGMNEYYLDVYDGRTKTNPAATDKFTWIQVVPQKLPARKANVQDGHKLVKIGKDSM